VDHLVPERVWKETERALGERNPEVYFQLLLDCGALPRLTAGHWRQSGDEWRALRRAVAMASPAPVRFAVLFSPDQAAIARAVAAHWKAPTSYSELCRLSVAECPAAATIDNAADAFSLIKRCDALRRPERFAQMLQSCAARGVSADRLERLQLAASRASAVSSAPLLAQGLQGVALGAALDSARRAAIEALWQ
jgi:tRNA nucleotidyltransferase (CCA-adding enzyme)